MKSELTKKTIVEKTIELILETDGNVEEITVRRIAERANVGIGLVNHYFESKDKLIEVCVQQIISGVVHSFQIKRGVNEEPLETTKFVAKQVLDFLMEQKEISKVSILGDLKQPELTDNTMGTVMGFGNCLSDGKIMMEHKVNAFLLTSILQESFLRKEQLKEAFGIDFYNKQQRDTFIDLVVDKIGR